MFDGHGGSIASEFAKNHMADHISNSLERSTDNRLEPVLIEAFNDLNNSFTRHLKYEHSGQCMGHGTNIVITIIYLF